MKQTNYLDFIIESFKITLFCLLTTGLFKLSGASNKNLLIVFNMAVMSCAATFSVEKKHLGHIGLGSIVIFLSVVTGGVVGYYLPSIGIILTILYAGLAFYLPKTKIINNILVTGALMFLIFNALPFYWKDGLLYSLYGIVLTLLFISYNWLFEGPEPLAKPIIDASESHRNHITAFIAVLSLVFAFTISYYLHRYTSLDHLYWIGLTVLVVIQSSQEKTIQTAIKRIIINAIGAISIVLLFFYLVPNAFWVNFAVLTLFLFLIFSLGFSYVGKTLFIEWFVLGFTHLMGNYQIGLTFARFYLTLIGGSIVIMTTCISFLYLNLEESKNAD